MNKEAGSVKKRRSPGAARRLTLKRSGAASSLCGNLSRQSRAMPGPRRSEADSCRLDLENSEALGPGPWGPGESPKSPLPFGGSPGSLQAIAKFLDEETALRPDSSHKAILSTCGNENRLRCTGSS